MTPPILYGRPDSSSATDLASRHTRAEFDELAAIDAERQQTPKPGEHPASPYREGEGCAATTAPLRQEAQPPDLRSALRALVRLTRARRLFERHEALIDRWLV